MTKKQISADESIKKFRELLSYIEDEDELQLPLAKWLNKGNWGTVHEIAVNKTQILFLKATMDLE